MAALVGHDTHERIEVRLPGFGDVHFRGPSVAELLDDAALHLMTKVPGYAPAQLQHLVLNPSVCLRTVGIDLELAFRKSKKVAVAQRLTVFCEKWPYEPYWIVRVPRLGGGPFAVAQLSELRPALHHWLHDWAVHHGRPELEAARSLQDEYLVLLDVEVELPSILPSRKAPKRPSKKPDATEPSEVPEKVWIPAQELPRVGVNLVHRALDGRLKPALGRDALVQDLVEQLARDGSAILLVGERGVGKTAVIEAVAQRFAERGDLLKQRTDCWRVDGSRLIAGMSYVGQWEARLARVVNEIHQRDDVLLIDDLPSLAWAGRSAQSDTTMAGFLTPHLERGELRILAECSPERLEAARLVDPGFFAHFRVIRVPALDADATYEVLLAHAREAEATRNLVCGVHLLETVQAMAARFGARMVEPGRSVSMAQRFFGEVKGTKQDRYGRIQIDAAHFREHVGVETGLPDFVLTPGQARPAEAIEGWFRQQLVGQPTAIDCVTDVVCTLQQGLDDPDRPIATLLFVGPTGVGKTEAAKALATYLFGDVGKLLRFDMSEVQGPGALQRLVGGPGQPDGDLTRAVSNAPFSVVLLDEIEKAGPQVFDLLLQVLGEGRLTNAAGQTTDFRNTVVIMTSNLGARQGRRRTGFDRGSVAADATHYRSAAQDFFRPEFYNRIDRVVPFRSLGLEDVEPLVQRIVSRVVGRRGLRSAGVVVRLDPNVRAFLAEEGFDPQYGARSLQRVVERELTVPLARVVVEHPPHEDGLFLEVWRDGTTHIVAQSLASGAVDTARGPLEDWAAIAAQHGRLVEQVAALVQDARFQAIEIERSALLESADRLDDAGWDRLTAATAVVEARSTLLSDLEDFASDRLASHHFVDTHAKVTVSRRERHRWQGPKVVLLGHAEPQAIDRKRTLGAAASSLLDLELRVGGILHRLGSHGDASTLVVRFQPLHDEAGGLAKKVAEAFERCWEDWGRCTSWRRREGTWSAGSLVEGEVALEFAVPGLRRLLEPFEGLYLRGSDLGGDRLLELIRVDLLDGDAAATLLDREALDAAEAERRRRGEGAALPPVRFRFGVLRPDDPALPTLDALDSGLRRLALLREVR